MTNVTAPLTDAQKLAIELGASIKLLPNGNARVTRKGEYDFEIMPIKRAKVGDVKRVRKLSQMEGVDAGDAQDATFDFIQSLIVDKSLVLEDVLSLEDATFLIPHVMNEGKIEDGDDAPLDPTED